MEEATNTIRFYEELPVRSDFSKIADSGNFTPVPEDWHILLSDVADSTGAIEKGRYKDVNIVGASTLIAVLNAVENTELPFVFGGDRATLLAPETLLRTIKPVLLSTRTMAKEAFGLNLRVGLVPVSTVRKAGHEDNVARFKLSSNITLAAFSGGGLGYAESLLKDPEARKSYRMEDYGSPGEADFTGLECRWNDIPGTEGEIVSLLVMARSRDPEENAALYRGVIEKIDSLYGSEEKSHPVSDSLLSLSFQQSRLSGECLVKNYRKSSIPRKIILRWMQFSTWGADFLMRHAVNLFGVHWGSYRDDLIKNSDYRKFDEMIRMVLSGGPEERTRLEAFLEDGFTKGVLTYGLHVADRALLTCLIFAREGNHLHFVDGADGGYAEASRALKNRIVMLEKRAAG